MTTYNDSILSNIFQGIKRTNSTFSTSGISASDCQNVELFDTGVNSGIGIRTMKGNTAIFKFENPEEKIINIFESVQKSISYCFVHTETNNEGRLYLYNKNSNTMLIKKSGLTRTGISSGIDFAQGYDDLFVFTNGEEFLTIQLGKYDSNSNLDEIDEFSPVDVEGNNIKGLGLTVFDGRLWVFNGVRLWYSVKENCTDFTTNSVGITTSAGYIDLVKKITAITAYLGSLAIFHRDSSCLLNINSDYTYSISDESPGGCAGVDALVFHGALLFFYDNTKKALFAFSQIVNGDKTLVDNIAKDVQTELMDIDDNKLNNLKLISVIKDDRHELWLILPSKEKYSVILIYDYIHSQWLKRKSQKLSTAILFKNNLISVGDNKIFLEYNGNDFDGEFIEAFYKCSPLNLSADNTIKVLYIPPRITLDMNYSNDFWVEYVKNYDSIKKCRTKRVKSQSYNNLFYWDISFWDSGLFYKPNEISSIKRLPTFSFKTLEIKFYTTASTQGFAIKNIEFSRIKVKQV